MKTARLAEILEAAGMPKLHLLVMDPSRDRQFQSALKENRVLTVHQQNVGERKDVGKVGCESEGPVQVLVFERSLEEFEGMRVVEIDYDLLEEERRVPIPRTRSPGRNRISKAPRFSVRGG